ncbi:MAG: class I SAM-dependent methyltransferase [Chloroflexi bacterium]|nr:class I SAM-dependent methyltransferase [Chloroflexota bacterium]
MNPPPPMEIRHYENPSQWTAERYLGDAAEVKRFAASAALLPESGTLLDIGTGNGAFLRYLEDHNTPLDLLGLERSTAAREAALCRAEIRAGSAETLPFDDRSFEVITALEVIEHLPFGVYESALDEMQRVAAAAIVISVPYREPRRRVNCPYCGCGFHPNYHMRRFDEARMETLFPAFKLERLNIVRVPDYVVMPAIRWWGRLLRPTPFPATAVCPQCGYARTGGAAVKPPRRKPLAFVPVWQRPNWFVALYRRR